LIFRFVLDLTMIIIFLRYLFFFVRVKIEKIEEEEKTLTCFHKFVITYILLGVLLQLFCSIIRSFFGPLILVENEGLVLPKFVETYRLLVYSISDFFIGIALLYLFYHQGMITLAKR